MATQRITQTGATPVSTATDLRALLDARLVGPVADLSLFARGSFASPRRLHVMTAADPTTYRVTRPTIRTLVGVTLANVAGPLDLDLVVDNPLFLAQDAPFQVDGSIAGLIERRRFTEVFATLRYER
jgi:hypothetical protein